MKYKYKISGLDCAHCAMELEEEISKLENISNVKVNFLTETIRLESEKDMKNEIEKLCKRHDAEIM